MSAVAANDAAIVALGSGAGAQWSSTNGTEWATSSGFGAADSPQLAVARPTGFVAVGTSGGFPVAWASSNGRAWHRHVPPLDWKAQSGGVFGLAVGRGVIVAIGWSEAGVCTEGGSATNPCRSRSEAWWSSDGASWHLAEGLGMLPGGVEGLTATDEGFVASGFASVGRSAFRHSADGRRWSRVAGATLRGAVLDLTYFEGRYVATLNSRSGANTVIETSNLTAWTTITSTPFRDIAISLALVTSFVPVAGGVDAVVCSETACDILQSSDRHAWSVLSLDPLIRMLNLLGLTEFHGRLEVAANDSSGTGGVLSLESSAP